MKKTKMFVLWLFLILTVCMTMWFCPACNEDKIEPLTEMESKFVGTWELEDISYIDYSDTKNTIYRYPSSSSTFNSLCLRYLNKTKLIFNDIKKTGEINGSLYVVNDKHDFSWHGWNLDKNVPRIDFENKFKLLSYVPKTDSTSSVTVTYAIIMDDGKLRINPTPFMIYVFKKQ